MMNKIVTEVSEYKVIRTDEENVKIIRTDEENVKIIKAGAIGEKGETGAGVAQGGSIGEILTKSSATDYDTDWQSTSDLNIALTSNNLSDMADLAAVKQNLNLVIGEDVQAHSEVLSNTTASFTTAEKSKLAGIESNATGDQSSSDIISLLNDDPAFNLFTDAEKLKLQSVEGGATGDQSGSEIKALYEAQIDTNAFTDDEKTKLFGIEAGATADQTAVEIKSLYESNSDTNVFTDAEKSKLASVGVDGDPNQNAFSSIVVAGQTTIEADNETDSLTFVAGTDISITTDHNTDEITISALGLDAATIKSRYESNSDTNAFTDAYMQKLEDLVVEEYLGVPQFTDYTDSTYFYFGWNSINGSWLIQRQVRSSSVTTSANIVNNSSYATLIDAWTDRAILTYA